MYWLPTCWLLWPTPVGAIKYIDKEVNEKDLIGIIGIAAEVRGEHFKSFLTKSILDYLFLYNKIT